jgi:hypothetical protein
MADAKGTARNAYLIEVQMKAAVAYMEEAKKAVRIAQDTVISGGEDDMEMGELITMQRMLSMGLKDANRIVERWTDYRIAREKQ